MKFDIRVRHGNDESGGCAKAFKLATTLPSRARGMLGSDAWDGELLLAPCRGIHTVGMKYDIDVAFIDSGGLVLKAVRGVRPGERVRCRGSCAVLERQADADHYWYEEGQHVAMCVQ